MKNTVISPPFNFVTNGRSFSSLQNRYKLGKVRNGSLYIDRFECLFLLSIGKIRIDGDSDLEDVIEEFEDDHSFSHLFDVYFTVKKAGFYAKVEGNSILIRKGAHDTPLEICVRSEEEKSNVTSVAGVRDKICAVVDSDGDVTIFYFSEAKPRGTFPTETIQKEDKLRRRMKFDHEAYPEWLGHRKSNVRIISDAELSYVSGYSAEDELKHTVYSDLILKGIIPKSGFKYGADFRCYVSPESEHAEFLIYTVEDSFNWTDISRIVRISNAVRKEAILVFRVNGDLNYIEIKRFRDFNSLYQDQIWASKSSTVGLNSE